MAGAMKRKSAFGSEANPLPKLPPNRPDPDADKAIEKIAENAGFADREPKTGMEGQGGSEEQTGKVVPADRHEQGGGLELFGGKIQSSWIKEQEEPADFDELVKAYTEKLKAGEQLPLPPDPTRNKVPRHRLYQNMPVHTVAALQALTDAHGYQYMWMVLDDILKASGLYKGS